MLRRGSRFTSRLTHLGFTLGETGEGRDDSVLRRGYRIATTGFTKFWDRLPLWGGCGLAPFIVFSRCRNGSVRALSARTGQQKHPFLRERKRREPSRKSHDYSAVATHVPTRLSFGTAHRKRPKGLSHVKQTLMSGVPVIPAYRASLDAAGQWPVCRTGTSPTEEPIHLMTGRTSTLCPSPHDQQKYCILCQ